jgi:hypothetical protein
VYATLVSVGRDRLSEAEGRAVPRPSSAPSPSWPSTSPRWATSRRLASQHSGRRLGDGRAHPQMSLMWPRWQSARRQAPWCQLLPPEQLSDGRHQIERLAVPAWQRGPGMDDHARGLVVGVEHFATRATKRRRCGRLARRLNQTAAFLQLSPADAHRSGAGLVLSCRLDGTGFEPRARTRRRSW